MGKDHHDDLEHDERLEESLPPPVPPELKRFLWDMQSMVELTDNEREILFIGRDLMTRLVTSDEWLPAVFATPDSACHQLFQLYADGLERFSVTATVLAPGQVLPAALDPVWEIMGVLCGAVSLTRYPVEEGEAPGLGIETKAMGQGDVATFGSGSRDALRMGNALEDGISIVLHVHGGEMSKIARRIFMPDGEYQARPVTYANPGDAPPYDIFSIQTRIED